MRSAGQKRIKKRYKLITERQIQKLAEIVSNETKAIKMYLFGSYAEKKGDKDSDVDLLVVVKNDLSKEERRKLIASLSIRTMTENLFFPKDFKIYSLNEFNLLKGNKQSFLYHILKNSKPLYFG